MNMTELNNYSTKGYKVRLYPNKKQKKYFLNILK